MTTIEIPIKNLWLLMLYASPLFRMLDSRSRFAVEKKPDDIPDLAAEILMRAVQRRLLHNLSMELYRMREDLTRVRGRIDHIRTKRRHLLERGRIACSFEHFTANTSRNQFVKYALDSLTRTVRDKELRKRCHVYSTALERAGVIKDGYNVTPLRTKRIPDATVRINPEDRRMLAAAELALNLWMPAEESGDAYLPKTDRSDEWWLRMLFEQAIGGFYKVVLPHPEWNVKRGNQIYWQKESYTKGMLEILPKMITDIRLDRRETQTRMIIDTKFTEITTQAQYDEKRRLKSDHIYQIYAYVRSQEKESDPPSRTASGMLLYPSLGVNVDESVIIQGHKMRFATVDLAAESASIRERLLELVLGKDGAAKSMYRSELHQMHKTANV